MRAARRCLAKAHCPPDELDLLVNAGIYRDRNLGEPALAALIQEDIGAHPEDPHPGDHGTFSFDVANGTAGVLTALRVVDGFLRSGTVRRGLVVTADADPGHGLSADFPFAAAGGALLCRWSDDDSGLGPFRWVTVPDGGAAFHAAVSLEDGGNVLRIDQSDALDAEYALAAAKAARECLDSAGLAEADLVVAAPARPAFGRALAEHLGVASARVVVARDDRMHTAALVAALHDAFADPRVEPGATMLLVAAGAGVTAGAAVYRVPPDS